MLPVTLPEKLPIKKPVVVILPVADICPAVVTLPPRILPVALTKPAVLILPPVTLPDALTVVPVTLPTNVPIKLPPDTLAADVMFPLAVINPPV